jgi:Na+/H+ antiporter NhaD/arsenite permease-like protein
MPFVLGAALCSPAMAYAGEIDGASLSGWWSVPFAGMLLSIAVCPLLMPALWHRHYGKISAAWALAFVLPFLATAGAMTTAQGLAHVIVADYIPFIILLTALFAVAGGIFIQGNLHGTPGTNVVLMLVGAVLASFMGTTGASMLMIRPLIRANDHRPRVVHVVVFFIFVVANAGGSLTPLGDPPLFLGFLAGVDFFWTAIHVFPETLFLVAALLLVFFVIDTWFYRADGVSPRDLTPDTQRFNVDGKVNLGLLVLIMGLVLLSGSWHSGISWSLLGTEITLEKLVRDVALIGVTLLSLKLTAKDVHERNHFSWGPMLEVAKLFAGIFVTIVPMIAMLRAGQNGAFAPVVALVTDAQGRPIPSMYFWASGLLSSFLDNAPTYLVFFNLAGGDPKALMGPLAPVLAAISIGSVFMGANSYIGNAPNLMVKAVAEHHGVPMPSFFGYMAWSCAVLLPLFVAMTFIFF